MTLPKGFIALRILQLIIAVVVLGLSAYGVTFLAFGGIGLTLFSAIATILIVAWFLFATHLFPVAYNFWAVLGVDIFLVIFWLISFSLLAAEVAAVQIVSYDSCEYYDYYCYKAKRSEELMKRYATTDVVTYRNALAAAAGLGGLEFLLFVISLSIFGVFMHRHRKSGGACMAGSSSGAPTHTDDKPQEYQMNQTGV